MLAKIYLLRENVFWENFWVFFFFSFYLQHFIYILYQKIVKKKLYIVKWVIEICLLKNEETIKIAHKSFM